MSNVKEAVYIHCGTKMGVLKPEEITKFSYMHSKRFFACPGCGVKVFHKRQKSSLCSTEAKAFFKSGNWEILY